MTQTSGRPLLMGILNVTPDSFSDGGAFFKPSAAIEHGLRMVDSGADIVDVGGESTRPGATPVDERDELSRVIPVIQGLARRNVTVSIDTMKHEVARQALDSGAKILNDVSGFRDPLMVSLAANYRCTVCVVHMQGDPQSMQTSPKYRDVVSEVETLLLGRASVLQQAGLAKSDIWIDPGIGFGKAIDHNLELIRHLPRLSSHGYPVLVGLSRKAFIGKILGGQEPLPAGERLIGTIAAQVIAQLNGAHVIRAHDVVASRQAIEVCWRVSS